MIEQGADVTRSMNLSYGQGGHDVLFINELRKACFLMLYIEFTTAKSNKNWLAGVFICKNLVNSALEPGFTVASQSSLFYSL